MNRLRKAGVGLSALLLVAVLVHAALPPAVAPKGEWKYSAALLRPFWRGTAVESEPVLFIRQDKGGEARANVLFPIERLIAVRNSAGDLTYREGLDFIWKPGSTEIILPAGSRITASTPDELRRPPNTQKYVIAHRDGKGEILFGSALEYHALQSCITYTHAPDAWHGPAPEFQPEALARTVAKLKKRERLSIVVVGDSISAGCNASGWAGGAPFQPAYPELLRRHLEKHYGAEVVLTNPSVGGTDTRWVLTQIDQVVAPQPDLVIVAFGMNDAAGRSQAEYRANIQAVIAKIRERRPAVEFVLVASMLGNPDWTRLEPKSFPAFRDALATLCEPGVALADVTSMWTAMLERKRYWDLTGNGVNHPNDFGHRVYAQVISALLIEPEMPVGRN